MMNGFSKEIMQRVEKNDVTLTKLEIQSNGFEINRFCTINKNAFSRLGSFIAENTNIKQIDIRSGGVQIRSGHDKLEVTNCAFYEGLERNSYISKVTLRMCQRYSCWWSIP